MFVDAHIHLSFIDDKHLPDFLNRGQKAGVNTWVQGGYDVEDWQRQKQLKAKFGGIYSCFGIHPWKIIELEASELETQWKVFASMAPSADLIGETGLDSFTDAGRSKLDLQVEYFHRHLDLNLKLQKPLVLHVVQSHGQALQILKAKASQWCGLVHSFSGSTEIAKEYLKLGFLISIGPGILEPGYKKLKDTVANLEMESFVIESDSPQSPQDLNPDPEFLLRVAECVSQIKGLTPTEILQGSSQRMQSLLHK